MSDRARVDWNTKPLGELAAPRRGITYTSDLLQSVDGGLPYVNMKCFLKGGGFNPAGMKTYAGRYCEADILTARDVLLANTDVTDGDIVGAPALLPPELAKEKVLFSHHVTRLRLSNEVFPPFLYYLLCLPEYRARMLQIARGTTVLMLDMNALERVPIRTPVLESEQRRVAEILSTVDEAIEQTEALIAKTQQIKVGLMHDLFTRGITLDGQLRLPRREAPQLYKESPLGWIPKEWEPSIFGDEIGGIDSGWSPNCESTSAPLGEWAVLKTTAVVWEGYAPSENKSLSPGTARYSRITVQPQDILITRKGPVDRVGVAVHVPNTPPNLMFPDTVFRTRLLPESKFSPIFFALELGCAAVQKYWWQRKVGLADAQVNLNHSILRSTPLARPNEEEQDAICARMHHIAQTTRSLRSDLHKLTLLKSGLMQDFLTGRVRVPTLNASDLKKIVNV